VSTLRVKSPDARLSTCPQRVEKADKFSANLGEGRMGFAVAALGEA
jgi:hypothetical protein